MSALTSVDTVLLFGAGYSAQAFSALLPTQTVVIGTSRMPTALSGGIAPVFFDGHSPVADFSSRFKDVTGIVVSIPPVEGEDPVLRWHQADVASFAHLRWVAYLSTTAVYGDAGGAWVDETSPLKGTSPRAKARIAAETAWLSLYHRQGVPVHIFRLAGIYGPGRNALLDVQAGRAHRIDKPGQVFSRIHQADIARALLASYQTPTPGTVYNLADDAPCSSVEVVEYAASLSSVPPPPLQRLEQASLSPMARSFYTDCKRVHNQRIKQNLGLEWLYPTYRDGLNALYQDMIHARAS